MHAHEEFRPPLTRARLLGLMAAAPLVAVGLWLSARIFGPGEAVGVIIMFGSALIAGTCSKMSLRSVFGGTFWVAVCFACYAIIQREHRAYSYGGGKPWSFWVSENVLGLVMMLTPFIAAGAFFGRSVLGAMIGVLAVALFWFIWSLS